MADIFAKGTSENNNIVTKIVLKDKIIGDCISLQNGIKNIGNKNSRETI